MTDFFITFLLCPNFDDDPGFFILNLLVVGSNLKSHISKKKRHKASFFGRDYRIRTYDILLPKQALYQAELSPVKMFYVL